MSQTQSQPRTLPEPSPRLPETATPKTGAPAWKNLAAAIRSQRHALSLALMTSVADWEKYQPAIDACGPDKSPFLTMEIHAFVDYLARYFDTGDDNYRHLYVGEKLKQLYDNKADFAAQQARRELVTQRDTAAMAAVLKPHLGEAEFLLFHTVLADISRILTTSSKKSAKLLMIGDCLHLDVMGFLASSCLADGIGLEPTFVTDKNGVLVRRTLKEFAAASRTFDLVFYSPFTYAFSLAYAQLLNARHAVSSRRAIQAIVDEAWKETEATLDLLADAFECTIVVHNSSNIMRHGDTVKDRVKHALTARTRRFARTLINKRLAAYISKKNADTYEHFFPLDELALAQKHGELEMGRYFYQSRLQHPAHMGKAVAEIYRDLVFVQQRLLTKKLVVCDLDNTLWAGVIGEGAVTHHLDRQQVLQRLRKKGVVLAVNSKNDPKNVHWKDAALCEADFVNMQINWEPKVSNFKRIKDALNLGYKDYLFLDDRADERAMAASAYPEMLALDPEDHRTSKLLDLWAQMLPSQEGDRTAFYKSRETRNQFLEEKGLSEDDVSAAFEALAITVHIRKAAKSDLKRAAELINRTNQFNMQGSRTTLKEVQAWHEDPAWKIFLVDAGDKFGSMGTVSVLICRESPEEIQIPIFVLSCRVFGYGIEDAMLNHLKRTAAGKKIVGLLQETPSNAPCRQTYSKNVFTPEASGNRWICTTPSTADPAWLTITID